MNNLYAEPRQRLDDLLTKKLEEQDDDFHPGMEYIQKWGYAMDAKETVPYTR